jgi:predicted DNA-binding transcriptional regulator AlpA
MSTPAAVPATRLAYRLNETASSLGISIRSLDRARASGRFPPPDQRIGRCLLYKPSTIEAWLEARAADSPSSGMRPKRSKRPG